MSRFIIEEIPAPAQKSTQRFTIEEIGEAPERQGLFIPRQMPSPYGVLPRAGHMMRDIERESAGRDLFGIGKPPEVFMAPDMPTSVRASALLGSPAERADLAQTQIPGSRVIDDQGTQTLITPGGERYPFDRPGLSPHNVAGFLGEAAQYGPAAAGAAAFKSMFARVPAAALLTAGTSVLNDMLMARYGSKQGVSASNAIKEGLGAAAGESLTYAAGHIARHVLPYTKYFDETKGIMKKAGVDRIRDQFGDKIATLFKNRKLSAQLTEIARRNRSGITDPVRVAEEAQFMARGMRPTGGAIRGPSSPEAQFERQALEASADPRVREMVRQRRQEARESISPGGLDVARRDIGGGLVPAAGEGIPAIQGALISRGQQALGKSRALFDQADKAGATIDAEDISRFAARAMNDAMKLPKKMGQRVAGHIDAFEQIVRNTGRSEIQLHKEILRLVAGKRQLINALKRRDIDGNRYMVAAQDYDNAIESNVRAFEARRAGVEQQEAAGPMLQRLMAWRQELTSDILRSSKAPERKNLDDLRARFDEALKSGEIPVYGSKQAVGLYKQARDSYYDYITRFETDKVGGRATKTIVQKLVAGHVRGKGEGVTPEDAAGLLIKFFRGGTKAAPDSVRQVRLLKRELGGVDSENWRRFKEESFLELTRLSRQVEEGREIFDGVGAYKRWENTKRDAGLSGFLDNVFTEKDIQRIDTFMDDARRISENISNVELSKEAKNAAIEHLKRVAPSFISGGRLQLLSNIDFLGFRPFDPLKPAERLMSGQPLPPNLAPRGVGAIPGAMMVPEEEWQPGIVR